LTTDINNLEAQLDEVGALKWVVLLAGIVEDTIKSSLECSMPTQDNGCQIESCKPLPWRAMFLSVLVSYDGSHDGRARSLLGTLGLFLAPTTSTSSIKRALATTKTIVASERSF
jgi:hypothetical protein